MSAARPVIDPNYTPPVHYSSARIEMEDFNLGEHRVAYYDKSHGNQGGSYRLTHADIEPTTDSGGGFNLGSTKAGEWLTYTVHSSKAANHDMEFRVASAGQGGAFRVEVNGVDMTGPITVNDTGGWQ